MWSPTGIILHEAVLERRAGRNKNQDAGPDLTSKVAQNIQQNAVHTAIEKKSRPFTNDEEGELKALQVTRVPTTCML